MKRLPIIDPPRGADIHFHLFRLDELMEQAVQLRDLLSPEEYMREREILAEEARERFVYSRGILRQTLARYLNMDGRSIMISREATGKPRLLQSPGQAGLAFNLSHSGNHIALVFARTGLSVGVDIEEARSLQNIDRIAVDILSAPERSAFDTLKVSQRTPYLLSVWTRKEALLKADGSVRSHPPAEFCTGAGPDCSTVILGDKLQYSVASHVGMDGLSCALALSGPALEIIDMSDRIS